MIDTEENILFKKMRHELPTHKSAKYIKWLKEQDPNKSKDFHHILGSSGRLKLTDYLGILLKRREHSRIDKFKPVYFFEHLPEAIKNLMDYVKFLEGEK